MVLLGPGEQILAQKPVARSSDGMDGVLTVTNLRVVFEVHASQGLLRLILSGPRIATEVDAPLHLVRNANVSRGIVGRPTLHVETARGDFSVKTDAAEHLRAAISHGRSTVPPPPPAEPAHGHGAADSGPVPVVVHLPAPAPPAVYLHCRHCGTLNAAGTPRCTSCGAAL